MPVKTLQIPINRNSFITPSRTLARVIYILLTAFWIFAMMAVIRTSMNYPAYARSIKLWAVCITFILLQILLGVLVWVKKGEILLHWQPRIDLFFSRFKIWNLIPALLVITGFFALVLGNREYAPLFANLWVRIYLLLWASLAAGAILRFAFPQPFLLSWFEVMLVIGVIWQILMYFHIQLGYPFSLDWSETSWYYYASFFTARKFYGVPTVWPFLDIGRPLLLAIPFLVSIRSLAFERVWESLLWVVISGSLSYLLVRRIKVPKGFAQWLFVASGFVWILLGPIYYHLAISAIIVLAGYNRKKLARSLFWLIIASLWAGAQRINWIPVPAMLCLALYFLESPFSKNISWWDYLKRPLVIAIGGAGTGLMAFLVYAFLSGRADTKIVSKFTSPFLISRLLPNGTLPVGILPAALFLSSVLIIFIWSYGRKRLIHPLRWGLLYSMLLILFAGGIYASIKIGGGNNLHNLDAYWTMLLIILFYALSGKINREDETTHLGLTWHFSLLFICVPAFVLMLSTPDIAPRDNLLARQELTQLTQITQKTSASGGKVLFIADRHLLTFGMIKGVPLVPEYELEELTEMSNSGNSNYLSNFRSDLAAKKFQLIVINTVTTDIQGNKHSFANENNAWRNGIVVPLLLYYQPVLSLSQSHLEVYQPIP